MDKEQDDQVIKKMQLLNKDIKTELEMNPNIIDKEAFMDALRSNVRRFINKNYRD